MRKILSEDENLNFKEFLSGVMLETVPEDQKDDTFFGLKDWMESGFTGIPSAEVQREIDLNIKIWLEWHTDSEKLIDNLYNVEKMELATNAALISSKYALEKAWEIPWDLRPFEALSLFENWLKDKSSVPKKKLVEASVSAMNAANQEYRRSNYRLFGKPECAAYSVQPAMSISWGGNPLKSGYFASIATSHQEVCKVIVDKLPKFNFEDLVRWGYFKNYSGKERV